ncbi:MAG: transposase [Candidatus Tectimicrobiota bacterium]
MLELAEIFQRYGPAYRAKFADRMLPSHLAAMEAIERCRTEALGGHLYQCHDCGELEYRYHSCKNRHCPKCQNAATTHWLAQQRALLLPVPYFLVTFTLPEELRPVTRSHQKPLYNLLFQTSAAALQALALDPHYLGGQLGMVGVLHTWTRDLAYHPHVHYLVPGGALSPDGCTWLSPRSAAWLVPVRALSRLFRGKFHAALATATDLSALVPPQVWGKDWVTHCQPAGSGTEVLTYFAPYIYRIALTNNRLEALDDGYVTFRFKRRGGPGWRRLTLPADAFIHRFLQHVLPKGFPKVRAYGLLSPSRRKSLPQIRTLLAGDLPIAPLPEGTAPRALAPPPPMPPADRGCRHCGGPLVFLGRLAPHPREPP